MYKKLGILDTGGSQKGFLVTYPSLTSPVQLHPSPVQPQVDFKLIPSSYLLDAFKNLLIFCEKINLVGVRVLMMMLL
jgi:hypothetical protein